MKSKLPVTAHKAFHDQLLPGAVVHPLLCVSCLTLQGCWPHSHTWLSALLGMPSLAPAHLSRVSSGLPSPETQSRSPSGCDRSPSPWFSWHRGPASICSPPLPYLSEWLALSLSFGLCLYPQVSLSLWEKNEHTEVLWTIALLGCGEEGTYLKSIAWLTSMSLEGVDSTWQLKAPEVPQTVSSLLMFEIIAGFSMKAFNSQSWRYAVGQMSFCI